MEIKNDWGWDFPDGPVVKNPSGNAGDMGSIPGQRTKIPRAAEQLSLSATTTEHVSHNYWACEPQLERFMFHNKDPVCHNQDLMQPNM